MPNTRMAAKRLAPLGWALLGSLFICAASAERVPAPHDWSHRHLIFSNPDTLEEAMSKGDYNEWARNYRDPRFVLALVRKMERQEIEAAQAKARNTGSGNGNGSAGNGNNGNNGNGNNGYGNNGNGNRRNNGADVHRDWSYPMGSAAGVGSPGVFPAKYNFDISAAPSCANDFVVYPTSTAGVVGSGSFASQTGTVSGNLGNGNTVTVTNGASSVTLTADAAQNTGLFFQNVTSSAVRATNLANAINRNGFALGVRATAAAAVVTVSALAQGTAANSITVSENLSNFSWNGQGNNTNVALAGGSGGVGQSTIFAVNQLYSSCVGAGPYSAPTIMWSYNTGTGAIVDSSPILSLDGTQVAFIQRTGGVASLVLLKWAAVAAGSATTIYAPVTLAAVGTAAYRACAAPCMTTIALSGNPNNTNSSPYYYYDTDTLWVGDNSGSLHKFTGIFLGTPAESGAPWPVVVSAGRILSPPVYDSSSNKVYVGTDREANTTVGGRLHGVSNATGAVDTSILLAGDVALTHTGSTGVAEAVIVDQLAQRLYVFVATDPSASCGGVECHAVYQFATNATLASQATPNKATLGRGQIFTRIAYAGIFDNAYYSSTPASPTGYLYACGSNGGAFATSRHPNLWRIPITANVMATTAEIGPSLVSADTADGSAGGGSCSPITDIQNGANNYIFVSVPQMGNQTGCAGSCVYMFNLTGVTLANWPTRTAVAGLTAPGGTGGIVIDNSSSVTGASQIYYMTLTNPGSAMAEDDSKQRPERQPPEGKRTYVKPAFRHERVFETMALACGKINVVQASCRVNRRNS